MHEGYVKAVHFATCTLIEDFDVKCQSQKYIVVLFYW